MNEIQWDAALQGMGGHLLQSWRWGDFKERQGWKVSRLRGESSSGSWMAQVLFKFAGPVSIAYIPCGPIISGDHSAVLEEMMREIDAVCRQHRAITLIMEPNQIYRAPGTFKEHGFVKWLHPIQPRETMLVPVGDDESMLSAMHHKTRYHIRLAGRKGMVIEERAVSDASIAAFHALHAETVERNEINLLSIDYFEDLLTAFTDQAALIFALAEGRPAAAALMVRFGDEASYLFAGSSRQNRGQGAGAFLVFRALQWACEHGCANVDLGNVSSAGLREFKAGFGGIVQTFPVPLERRYHPLPAMAARRLLAKRIN